MGENGRAAWDQKPCVIGSRALERQRGSKYLDSGFISLCKVANVSGILPIALPYTQSSPSWLASSAPDLSEAAC